MFVFWVSRGPTRILSFGRPRVVWDSPLVFVLILSVLTSERYLVMLVIDLEAFCASVGFVSVLCVGAFCSRSAIIRLSVHPLSCSLVSRVRRGSLEVRLWEFAF